MTLYKYLRPERVHVLRDRELRFTQASAMNDPFELNPYFETVVTRADIEEAFEANPPDITENLRQMYDGLPAEQKQIMPFETVLLLSRAMMQGDNGQRLVAEALNQVAEMARELTPGLRDQMLRRLRNEIGILSLSEIRDGMLLWTHYADEHRGYAIGFDDAHPFFNRPRAPQDDFFQTRKVNYTRPSSFANLMELAENNLLFAKAPDWEYEAERRMLMPTSMVTRSIQREGETIHLVSFPPDCVEQVVLGARASGALEMEVRMAVDHPDYAHVSVYRARLDTTVGRITVDTAH